MSQYKLVPVEPNKAALIGEFKFKITETCPQCFYEEPRDDCEICEGANNYQREITVPWATTKEIHRAMLESAPAVNDQSHQGLIDELAEALRAILTFVYSDTVACHGDKCRELVCRSCFPEEEAEENAAFAREYEAKCRQTLAKYDAAKGGA